ncbi:MAG: FG-GAP-like repeat-containing protein [Acidobacteriaceae bacterium]
MWNLRHLSACVRPRRGRNTKLLLSALMAVTLTNAAQAAAVPSTTTLVLSSTSVTSLTAVTLTASVVAGGAPVAIGSVTFCDASAPHCEDSAVVGTAQLVAGTAKLKYVPGIGTHKYIAVFSGTAAATGSSSSVQTLTVTGLYPTTTAIAATGNPSGYDLTATVVGYASHPPVLAGTVSFQDTSNGNFVLGTAPLGAPTYAETFTPAAGSPISTGNQPTAGGAADFNGDGIQDLAVFNSDANSITVFLGKGDGTFNPVAPIFGVGTVPCISQFEASNCALTVGDFNHDGNADLVATSGFDNTVTVLLGHGDGTFSFANGSPITVGNFPQAVKIGDFNADGLQDLAVANAKDNTISILLGNGDGTFTPATGSPVAVGSFPFFVAVADFDRNGTADIAVSNDNDNTVTILLGNGDGTFTEASGSPIPNFNYNPGPIISADFNGDGKLDLAVSNFTPFNNTLGNVVVLLGNGDGTFANAPGSPITVGVDPFALAAVDFNQDGKTDLAVDNYGQITNFPTQTLSVLLGNGDGTFAALGTPIQLGDSPNDLVTADFNGDGATDFAIPELADNNVTILLNAFTQTETANLANVTIAGTGTHYVDAVYLGNSQFATSTSTTVPLQGVTVPTTLTLTANPTEQMLTMPVTFTAQLAAISPEPPSAIPTGTVTFFDQSVNATLGTAPMGANGQAVFTTTSIGPGHHTIIASYSGDPDYLASTSNTVPVQIDELRILRVGNNNTNILPGTTVVYTIQVEPQVATTFLYNVNFAATGLPAGAIAIFNPPTLQAGGKIQNITMTVMTAKAALSTPPASPFSRAPLALGLLLPLIGVRSVRRRLRKVPPFLAAALLAVLSLTAVAGLSGCSGAGLFAERKVPYTITVTATEGTLQRSTTVPLAIY